MENEKLQSINIDEVALISQRKIFYYNAPSHVKDASHYNHPDAKVVYIIPGSLLFPSALHPFKALRVPGLELAPLTFTFSVIRFHSGTTILQA